MKAESEMKLINNLSSLPGAGPVEIHRDGLWMDAPELDVKALAQMMAEQSVRLSTMTATALEDGETDITYHYVLDAQTYNIKARTRKNTQVSITPITPAAGWIEREIFDLFAVTFQGHPDLRRLVRPPQIAAGFFRQPGGAAAKIRSEKGG